VAVSVAYSSVVVRKSTVAARFPGGIKAYAGACPNASFCSDDKIARVGFMAFDDANAHVAWLRSHGFVVSGDAGTSEIALIREDKVHLVPCTCLELGRIDGHPVAWLTGTEPGPAHIPEADRNREDTPVRLSPEDLRERYELVTFTAVTRVRIPPGTPILLNTLRADVRFRTGTK